MCGSYLNFDNFRDDEGNIDLVVAYQFELETTDPVFIDEDQVKRAVFFLRSIMRIQPIRSRQVAAVCIVMAKTIQPFC
jgi:hypothetical protein